MIPDGERLISDYLRSLVSARVVGKTPSKTDTAWVKVTLLNAQDEAEPVEWFIRFTLQLDCYAGNTGGQPEVNSLAASVRGALSGMAGTHAGGVVSAVRFLGMARIPDVDFKPQRERVILTVAMYAHHQSAAVST